MRNFNLYNDLNGIQSAILYNECDINKKNSQNFFLLQFKKYFVLIAIQTKCNAVEMYSNSIHFEKRRNIAMPSVLETVYY